MCLMKFMISESGLLVISMFHLLIVPNSLVQLCMSEAYFLLEYPGRNKEPGQSRINMRAAWSVEITFRCAKTLQIS